VQQGKVKAMSDKKKGILFTLLAAVCIASTNVIGKLVLKSVNVETMYTVWFVFSSLIFLILSILTKDTQSLKRMARKEFIIIGLLNTASGFLWGYGLLYGGPNNVSFLGELSIVITILLGIFFLKERIRGWETFGILIALVGAFVIGYHNVTITEPGLVIILGFAFVQAIQNVYSKTCMKNVNATSLARARSFFTLLFFGGISLSIGRIQFGSISPKVMVYALIGAFLGAFVGYMAFFKALVYIEVSKSTSIRSIEPFFTAIFALLIGPGADDSPAYRRRADSDRDNCYKPGWIWDEARELKKL
jgi:drug/metabolite transporter (DMT)-like permease